MIVVGVLVVAVVAFLAVGLLVPNSWPGQLLQGAGILTATGGGAFTMGSGSTGGGGAPRYVDESKGIYAPVVDGNAGEWDLINDFFANMHRAADPTKPIEAKVYLRFDCAMRTMYALVLSAGDWPVLVESGEAWIALNNRSQKVSFTNFAWVEQGYDGDSGHAKGWEASFVVNADGSYKFWTHVNAFHGGESQTSEAADVDLTLKCYEETAVTIEYFTAERGMSATARGSAGVILKWATTSEVDNLGFNIYRAPTQAGPWQRLNPGMIPSLTPPGSTEGAAYEFVDPMPPPGTPFYVLEDVDTRGATTFHGPVSP
jgi:hypothetical protein